MRTGIAALPLHNGRCPRWLFSRMTRLSRAIIEILELEYGSHEILRRLADPYWFQAFGCVLGFDWHSSGLTTTVCGALKSALNSTELELAVAGGKGAASRATPNEIQKLADNFNLSSKKREQLERASKLTAKVDNALVQDGYQLYHHIFIFTKNGSWAVIQQGMNPESRYARRYHWLSDDIASFVEEPHTAICCDRREVEVLDLTAKASAQSRKLSLELVNSRDIFRYVKPNGQLTLDAYKLKFLALPASHWIRNVQKINAKTLHAIHTFQPQTYEELISIRGVGPATTRALALIAQLVYGAEPSWRDPVKYSFAHGGKDGTPYPVNRARYDESILTLQQAIENAKLGHREKLAAIKRLNNLKLADL